MRNMLFKGSNPKEELEFAKTALALGQPVDVNALIEALEMTTEGNDERTKNLKDEIKWLKCEIQDLQADLDDCRNEE